jgi:hypothetical protein
VPSITHFSEAGWQHLRDFKGRFAFVGDRPLLDHDEYGRARVCDLQAEKIDYCYGSTGLDDLCEKVVLKLAEWNIAPAVQLQSADGQPLRGVEWRSTSTAAGLVVNLCNYLKVPVAVDLLHAGRKLEAHDILTGQREAGPVELRPLEVKLLRIAPRP